MEQKKVQGFLQKTYKIIVDYQQEKLKQLHCGENTGNQFNIFEIIGISTREVYMCRILAELLNPNGLNILIYFVIVFYLTESKKK